MDYAILVYSPSPRRLAGDLSPRLVLAADEGADTLYSLGAEMLPSAASRAEAFLSLTAKAFRDLDEGKRIAGMGSSFVRAGTRDTVRLCLVLPMRGYGLRVKNCTEWAFAPGMDRASAQTCSLHSPASPMTDRGYRVLLAGASIRQAGVGW